jgi:hypothetical protein
MTHPEDGNFARGLLIALGCEVLIAWSLWKVISTALVMWFR